MFDTFLGFVKMASEQGLNILSIAVFCVAVTFITLTGFIVFVLVAKTVWSSLIGGKSKAVEPVQYTLLKQLLLPILTNGGKDVATFINDKIEERKKSDTYNNTKRSPNETK